MFSILKSNLSANVAFASIKQIVLIACLFVSSCKKDENPTPSSVELDSVKASSKMQSTTTAGVNAAAFYKIIPLNNFIYYNQGDLACANSIYRLNGCLPASILMGAHLRNINISVNASRFSNYCSAMGTSTSGTLITSGYSYLRNYVFGTQLPNYAQTSTNADPLYDTGRTVTKNDIRNYLSANYPVVALINYQSTTKLPSTTGNLRHFVLIVGLNETAAGTGSTIYFYDPNNLNVLKSCDYSLFLNSMKAGSSYNAYNYMRIG